MLYTLSVFVSHTLHLLIHPHSLFSAFILLLSSRPMLSLCSVYSCLMSSLAASIFRGFLDAWTLRVGRTARLCCTMSDVSLRGRPQVMGYIDRTNMTQSGLLLVLKKTTSGMEHLLCHLSAEDGVKVVIYLHLVGDGGQVLHLAVELGKGFIFETHHFLYLLLCHCDGRFWQSRNYGGTRQDQT